MTDRRDDILDYLDGQMDEARQAEFRQWLDQSPEHWEQFARLSFLHGAIGTQLRNEQSVTAFRIDSLRALRELPPDPEPAFKTVGHALAYIIERTVTPRRLIAAATAAALLLAASLLILFLPNNSAPAPSPAPPAIVQRPATIGPVATLTAARDAQWAGSSTPRLLTPGSKLHPGDRLTLTAGFAEVTTARGAVAILQAPCTVEILDDDNALRLHAGKLVGICETDTSKGFVVRTLHMDVTDLGTRFGVEVSERDSTEVHVLTGSVTVQTPQQAGNDPQPRLLYAGQAVRAQAGSDQWLTVPSRLERFAFPHEDVIPLPGTGFGLQQGKPDPSWQIVAYEGQAIPTPYTPVVVPQDIGRDGLPNRPDTSQWLHWVKTQPTADLSETYIFQARIQLPDHIDPATARITLQCAADNHVAALIVNGQRQPVRTEQESFQRHTHEITQGLVAGENIIGFEVINLWPEGRTALEGNAVGLRVEWEIRSPARAIKR